MIEFFYVVYEKLRAHKAVARTCLMDVSLLKRLGCYCCAILSSTDLIILWGHCDVPGELQRFDVGGIR